LKFDSPVAIGNFILSSTFVMITFEYTMPDIKLILHEIDTGVWRYQRGNQNP